MLDDICNYSNVGVRECIIAYSEHTVRISEFWYGLVHVHMSKTPDVSTIVELSSISGEMGKERARERFKRGRTMGRFRSTDRGKDNWGLGRSK